jgi:hypothetical protein
MALNANKVRSSGGKSKFKPQTPVAVGTYPARLVSIIDLGVQKRRPWKGEAKDPIAMIRCTYELTTEFMKDEAGNDDETKPRWVSEDFPFYSLNADRAKSTQRYLALDPQQSAGGNWPELLGAAVALTIVHNPNKDDSTIVYANIGATSPIMKGMAVAGLVNDTQMFDFDEPNMDVFNGLPDFLKDKIKGAENFNGSALAQALGGSQVVTPEVAEEPAEEAANPYG